MLAGIGTLTSALPVQRLSWQANWELVTEMK